jgi:hypothetical protein
MNAMPLIICKSVIQREQSEKKTRRCSRVSSLFFFSRKGIAIPTVPNKSWFKEDVISCYVKKSRF